MIAKTFSATVLGIDAHLIEVEVGVTVGMSVFNIFGLPDGTIKESCDRVLSAVNNSGFSFPVMRVVVNFVLITLRKIGPESDLPITMARRRIFGLTGKPSLSQLVHVLICRETRLCKNNLRKLAGMDSILFFNTTAIGKQYKKRFTPLLNS